MEKRIDFIPSVDKTAEAKDKLRRRRFMTGTAGLVLASVALTGCSKGNSDKDRYPLDKFDTAITQIDLKDGARLRHSPNVSDAEDNNVLMTVELSDSDNYKLPSLVPVDTKGHGVFVEHDNNGTWYGVEAADITSVLKNPSDIDAIKSDSDGIIWVNEQRAVAVESPSAEVSAAN